MTDLTTEALDALVHRLNTQRDCSNQRGAADTITALRAREAAIVAAAFEVAAELFSPILAFGETKDAAMKLADISDAIRALTPPDATAALERMMRAEALALPEIAALVEAARAMDDDSDCHDGDEWFVARINRLRAALSALTTAAARKIGGGE